MEIDYEVLNKIFNKDYEIIDKIQGGMTNFSHLIKSKNKYYILYQGSDFANLTIDRQLERHCQSLVYSLNITSKNIYFDINKGIKVNEYILGDSLNNVDNFSYEGVSRLLHTLHDSNLKSGKTFNMLEAMDNYLKILNKQNIKLDDAFYPMLNLIKNNFIYLSSFKKTICHNDFQKSNIVKSVDDKYYMIDFEFMMDNDLVYDLAAFANNDMKEGLKLLDVYFNHQINDDILKRFYFYRMYLSLQWYVLAKIKSESEDNDILGFDFNKVASFFFDNALYCYKYLTTNFK